MTRARFRSRSMLALAPIASFAPIALAGLALYGAACGSGKSGPGFAPSADGGADDAGDFDAAAVGTFAEAGGEAGAVGHLRGKVWAPQGTIPISGALVYLTDDAHAPDPIPSGVFCDKCVELPQGTPLTYSAADGSFDLPATSIGDQLLVVQKGAFRRVRKIYVAPGDNAVPDVTTTLPSKMDKSKGDDIPKMAVVAGQWDHIEASLAKLGLGQVDAQGNLVPGTESFDLYQTGSALDPRKLVTDAQTIAQYHVVFIPCSGSNGTQCDDAQPGESGVQSTLQGFVAAGGKLYVTDYSYEYVRQPFPGRIHWDGESATLGSACQSTDYDAPAQVGDPSLGQWLGAIGEQSVTLQKSWTTITGVSPVQDTDETGKTVTITPKVWVSAQKTDGPHPATVSFGHACGRVLFSTYHTEGTGGAQLIAQEKTLLYVLLEVAGVCMGSPALK